MGIINLEIVNIINLTIKHHHYLHILMDGKSPHEPLKHSNWSFGVYL